MLKILIRYKFSILIALAILYLSLRPTVPDVFYLSETNKVVYQMENRTIDYLYFRDFFGHMSFYFLFSLSLFYESLKANKTMRTKVLLLLVVVFPILFGGLIELLQEFFFPPRAAEWADWMADIAGCLFAYWVGKRLLHKYIVKR